MRCPSRQTTASEIAGGSRAAAMDRARSDSDQPFGAIRHAARTSAACPARAARRGAFRPCTFIRVPRRWKVAQSRKTRRVDMSPARRIRPISQANRSGSGISISRFEFGRARFRSRRRYRASAKPPEDQVHLARCPGARHGTGAAPARGPALRSIASSRPCVSSNRQKPGRGRAAGYIERVKRACQSLA